MKFKIIKAKKENIEDIGSLFNLYRQFYKYKSSPKKSSKYIKERILKKESTIFVCYSNKVATGFVQLYETFDSLNLNKKIILYDLFVKEEFRRNKIGKLLMNAAKKFALKNKYSLIELSTATTNRKAQLLYKSLGYKKDDEFYNYYLEVKNK
tara:strand:- start:32 stop:487 length:456 start_codon:yes stop_codon:yes gene_type:complete